MGTQPAGGSGRRSALIPLPLMIALLCFAASPPATAQGHPYCEELIASARAQGLHDDPYWHILMHYRKGLSGVESLIDDPAFFLAPDGKTNPASELEATIRSFFEPADDENDCVACRFAARFEWLRERLDIDTSRLPFPECGPFERFMKANRPSSVTLVFPMAHLNSPASMFGHTLLTIETADRTALMSYSVSYSAFTNETFGPFFAFKGIFGLYPGYFSVLPYYEKLEQYSDVDHRDIWEYRLNLTEPEIRRMMLHIRELESIASDYYFFQENCSYLLYFLLEAARPSLRLSDSFHAWLIPLDSVRRIQDQGLVTGVSYRPSRTTKIRHLASLVSDQGQVEAIALARGTAGEAPSAREEMDDREKRLTCDLAGEYLKYLYTRKRVPLETYRESLLNILRERSSLGPPTDGDSLQVPEPVRPDKGHRSNRLALGGGVQGDHGFAELRIRPAYHHLMDSDMGYVPGAQLIFGDLALRYFGKDDRLVLQSLDLIDIFSLCPRDRFFKPVSWKFRTGVYRFLWDDEEDHLLYLINPGGGIALGSAEEGMAYGMLETELAAGGSLEDNHALGIGGSIGVVKPLAGAWKAHLFARHIRYALGDTHSTTEATLAQSLALGADQSIAVEIARRKTRHHYETEAKVLFNLFF